MKGATDRYRSFHIPAWFSGIIFAMLISVHGHQGNYFTALDPLTFVFIVCLYVLFVMLTVYFVVWRTVVLNKQHPWHRAWVPRLFYQTATAVALPLFFLIIAHRLIAQLLPIALQQSLYLPSDVYLIVSFLIILNGWFAFAYVIERSNKLSKAYRRQKANKLLELVKIQQLESKYDWMKDSYEKELQTHNVQQIIADVKLNELQEAYRALRKNYLEELKKKNQEFPLHVVEVNSDLTGYKDEKIAYFRTANEMIFIGLRTGEEYFYQSGGLNRLEKELEGRNYMRINRNYLVPLSSVKSATLYEEQLLEILLDDAKQTKMVTYKEKRKMEEISYWLLKAIKIYKETEVVKYNHGGEIS